MCCWFRFLMNDMKFCWSIKHQISFPVLYSIVWNKEISETFSVEIFLKIEWSIEVTQMKKSKCWGIFSSIFKFQLSNLKVNTCEEKYISNCSCSYVLTIMIIISCLIFVWSIEHLLSKRNGNFNSIFLEWKWRNSSLSVLFLTDVHLKSISFCLSLSLIINRIQSCSIELWNDSSRFSLHNDRKPTIKRHFDLSIWEHFRFEKHL